MGPSVLNASLHAKRSSALGAVWLGSLSALTLLLAAPAWALDPTRHLSQYAHNAWTLKDGYLAGFPVAIAQTTDGYLWIGTEAGLVRFDGVRFVPWAPPRGQESYRFATIDGLLGARDGSLWIGAEITRGRAALSRWNGRELVNYQTNERIPSWSILEARNGDVWISEPFCQVVGAGLRCPGPMNQLAGERGGVALAQDSEGAIWLGASTGAIRWTPSDVRSYSPAGLESRAGQGGVRAIATASDGSVWIGMDAGGPGMGLQHFARGRAASIRMRGVDSSNWHVGALLLDRRGALWVGTADSGLYRVYGDTIEHYGSADGLSGDAVYRLYEDHEHNIWVATSHGLDRFRDTLVTNFSEREGVCTHEVDSVLVTHDGTLWIGGSEALAALREGSFSCIAAAQGLPGDQVTSLFEDHDHQLWVGVNNTMTIYDGRRFNEIRKNDGTRLGLIVAIAEDTNHDTWLISGTPHRALYRVRDRSRVEDLTPQGIAAPHEVAADPHGGLWLGLMNGDLARYRDGHPEVVHFEHEFDSTVNQIWVSPDGSVLAATGSGLLGWKNGTKRALTRSNGLPCDAVNAFVTDSTGSLWLFLRCGYVEISSHELQKWWDSPDATLRMRVLDTLDGMQPGTAPFQGSASTPDGRLWFANESTLQMIDPSRLTEDSPVPPPVHIEEIIADQQRYASASLVVLPAHTHNLEIDYTAPTFAIPQRVRFRYLLEGHDADWQDPGTRREAFYSDLRPGTYRFHVAARVGPTAGSIGTGTWSTVDESIELTIPPTFYQTRWFLAICALTCMALLTLFYRVRVRQVAGQVRSRLEARLGERERIARELHDTLLQGIQGLIWRFQAIAGRIPSGQPARQLMEQALDRAEELLVESRDRVQDLRPTASEPVDLAQALAIEGEHCTQGSPVKFQVSTQGAPRDLHPIVREEALLICREALGNAFRHAGAKEIEAEVTYADAALHIRIRDDGRGISDTVLKAGAGPRHFGLVGMRERAKKLGGDIEIWSKPDTGAEIDLRVPADVAYRRPKKKLSLSRLMVAIFRSSPRE